MKKFTKVIALTVVAIMALAVSASASKVDDIGFKMLDPVRYEAQLESFATSPGELDYVNAGTIPGNMTYVKEKTPFGTNGYLSHKYDASTANATALFQFGTGNGELNGINGNLQARLPGNLGKQKIEVIFKINDLSAVSGEVFDIRNFFVKNDGTTGVIGLKDAGVSGNVLSWSGRFDSSESDINLGSIEAGSWYKYVIIEDIPANIQNMYMEKWNAAANKFELARDAVEVTSDGRTCEGRNVYCYTSSVRVRLTNLMSWDIAQVKITRDNTLAYRSSPAVTYGTPLDKYNQVKTGIITNFNGDGGTTIVGRTYVAGNAFGIDGNQQPTSWYTYEDGTYLPRTTNPVLIVAQYDESGNLITVDTASDSIPTLNAGYRGKSVVSCSPTETPTSPEAYESVMQHELDFKTLEIRAPKADGVKFAKIYLWSGTSNMVPLTEATELK